MSRLVSMLYWILAEVKHTVMLAIWKLALTWQVAVFYSPISATRHDK